MPAQRKTNQSRRLTGAGLIAVTAATLLMMVWAIFPTAAFAATKPISVKSGSLTGHACDDSEWHFVINQIADFNSDGKIDEADAPATIHVTWADGSAADVALDGVNGHEASYTTTLHLDSTVTGATANIDSTWSGEFVLSHGPCQTPPEQGRIEIEKQTLPNGDPATFGFTGDLTSTLGDGGTDGKAVDAGTYHVTESAKTGWALTDITCADPTNNSSGVVATGIATFNVAPGETVHCTFTNTKNATSTTPPEQGRIEIEKQTLPNGDPATFGFTGDLTSTLGDGGTDGKAVDAGTYVVTESAKTGWALTDITCADPTNNSSGVVTTGIATFNVAPGETVHCTFTNTKNATTTTPGGGGGGGGGTTTTTPPAPTTTTTTPPTVAPTTIHNTSTTPTNEVLPTTVRPGGTAFTGVENVVPIGAIALMLMTSGSGLLWAGTRRRRHDGSEDED